MGDQLLPNLVAALADTLPAELGGTWAITVEGPGHTRPGIGVDISRAGVAWCRRTALIVGDRDNDPTWVSTVTTDLTERFRYAIARTN